jgi:hypothetical protein
MHLSEESMRLRARNAKKCPAGALSRSHYWNDSIASQENAKTPKRLGLHVDRAIVGSTR